MNRNFSLLVKPASFDCNLRCRYCFYLGKCEVFGHGSHRMSEEVLTAMIRKFMAVEMPVHSFGWQGGEPTLMGLDFFRRAVALQQQFGRPGQTVANGLQTNGTLLDDEWGKFLREYRFLVGISVDGPEQIHDLSRLAADGRGSHALVMRGMAALKRQRVDFNVLTLVSAANQSHPLEIYRYLRDELGSLFHQYIECVEFDAAGRLQPFAVTPGKWGEFLCRVFDEWYEHDTRRVSVRLFDSILTRLVEGVPNVCAMGPDCRQYFVVEHNGDVFPCDFYVRPEFRLGNIVTGEWDEFGDSGLYRDFGARKRAWAQRCAVCKYLNFCGGCCPKNRPGDPSQLSVLCEDWKMFYDHTLERFQELAARIVADRRAQESAAAAPGRPPATMPGRNDPCYCGSGRKFKKCCGR